MAYFLVFPNRWFRWQTSSLPVAPHLVIPSYQNREIGPEKSSSLGLNGTYYSQNAHLRQNEYDFYHLMYLRQRSQKMLRDSTCTFLSIMIFIKNN